MKILIAGDVVGAPGRAVFGKVASAMKEQGKADFVVVNGENAAGGKGITGPLVNELLEGGADVITMGDHTWDKKEIESRMDDLPRLVRPANYPPGCPGTGRVTVSVGPCRVTVINLLGRVFMPPMDCPFRTADAVLEEEQNNADVTLVDIHAEATSEKLAIGRYLDGRVTAVVGTHTHVQTSDERVLPGGTAYITDAGMTGVTDSVLGRDIELVTKTFLTGMPSRFRMARGKAVLEGVIVDADEDSGKARAINRLRINSPETE
ncbi:MAG: TIGR00282 family metallophosphoesterase [Kiritimatiellia bacterium]